MLTDAVLVDRVIAGFDDAFDELYRRHANAAWRLANAVTGNSHDAADAVSEAFARVLQAVRAGRLADGANFKSYLLTATRNAALDNIRKTGRTRPADNEALDAPSAATGPVDKVTGHEDAALVAEAFRGLPERWRSVLWLTEVEGVATKDAAVQLGLTPNGTAQLAVRARAGLRERYLQAQVRNHAKPECKFTVEHLGAYVGGSIAPRDLAKVDQHLAACADCRARKDELEDVGSTLRRIIIPLPLGLGALAAAKWHGVLASTTAPAASGLAHVARLARNPPRVMRQVVGASAAGVLALGLLSLGFVGDAATGKPRPLAAPVHTATTTSTAIPLATLPTPVDVPPPAAPVAAAAPPLLPPPPAPASVPRSFDEPTTPDPAAKPAATPQQDAPPSQDPPPATAPLPVAVPELPSTGLPEVSAGVNLNGTPVGVQVTPTPAAQVGNTIVNAPVNVPTTPNSGQLTTPVTGTVRLGG